MQLASWAVHLRDTNEYYHYRKEGRNFPIPKFHIEFLFAVDGCGGGGGGGFVALFLERQNEDGHSWSCELSYCLTSWHLWMILFANFEPLNYYGYG